VWAIDAEHILFCLYVVLGPLTWILFGVAMFSGRRRMMLLGRPHLPLPKPPPRATIVIPAKDEAERIRDCLMSALGQTYPNYQVIAVDDRSTDQTGRIMDELSATHPALRVVHVPDTPLPPGWTGKCHALHSAVPYADGDWLLFMDSDVVIAPDALAATLARSALKGYDVMSLWPKLESHSFSEGLLVPLAASGVSMMYLVSLTNKDYLRHTAFANGQYLLIRRSTYDQMGGHATVCDRYCEDVAIAQLLKSQGKRVKIAWGTDFASVRMYSSLSSIIKGWGRSFYAAGLGRPWRILAGVLFTVFCLLGAYVAAGWSVYRLIHPGTVAAAAWITATGLHLAIMTFLIMVVYAWSGNARRYALLLPLGAVLLLAIFVRSLWMCVTRRVEWRGTSYSHRLRPQPHAVPFRT
jgi:chlorobactene glucosyltransferase